MNIKIPNKIKHIFFFNFKRVNGSGTTCKDNRPVMDVSTFHAKGIQSKTVKKLGKLNYFISTHNTIEYFYVYTKEICTCLLFRRMANAEKDNRQITYGNQMKHKLH